MQLLFSTYSNFFSYLLRCTNDFVYPDWWLDHESKFFFDSSEECCLMVYNDAVDCETEDICAASDGATNTITPRPTHKPTRMPTRQPVDSTYMNDGLDHCSGKSTKKQCAKGSGCIWNYSYNSCVRAAAGDDVQANEGNTHACAGRNWHPKTNADRTCSNSLDYAGQHFFYSFKECCKAIYNGRCKREDVC